MVRDWFWLYRARAATHRAQSVQVVNAAHALATRGHRVTLCVQGGEDPLAFCGLEPVPTLDVRALPDRSAPASWAYWAHLVRWQVRTAGRGVVLARSKRHAARVIRWGRSRVLIEAHEVDSLQAIERGQPAAAFRALEQRVLRGSWGVVCNCEGTLAALRRAHPALPPALVLHNATSSRWPRSDGATEGIGYVGSLRPTKDVQTLARAAAELDEPIVLVGPSVDEVQSLQGLARGRLRREAPLAYGRVPQRLVRFRALLVTEGDGLFGRQLTSPLKLWDALASGVPIVAADTPAVRAVAGDAFVPYTPGDAASLVRALRLACAEGPVRARLRATRRVRTWAHRAAELEHFADRVLGSDR